MMVTLERAALPSVAVSVVVDDPAMAGVTARYATHKDDAEGSSRSSRSSLKMPFEA